MERAGGGNSASHSATEYCMESVDEEAVIAGDDISSREAVAEARELSGCDAAKGELR